MSALQDLNKRIKVEIDWHQLTRLLINQQLMTGTTN